MRKEKYNAKQGNYKDAYNYGKAAKYYEDSLNSILVKNQISEISYRYAQDTTLMNRNFVIETREKQISTLTIMIIALSLLFIAIIVSAVLYYINKKRKQEIKEMSMMTSLSSLRLENIRNRISPHFIFNVLNRELAANNKGINNLVNLLRMNLELCDQYCVPLSHELDFVDLYVNAEAPSIG